MNGSETKPEAYARLKRTLREILVKSDLCDGIPDHDMSRVGRLLAREYLLTHREKERLLAAVWSEMVGTGKGAPNGEPRRRIRESIRLDLLNALRNEHALTLLLATKYMVAQPGTKFSRE